MNMKKMSMWSMVAWLFGLLAAGETIHMVYLWVTGEDISPVAYLAEILLFVLISFFCYGKNQKKRQEEERSGPLVTEQQKKENKGAKKEPIVICPEGKPYLILGLVFYVIFAISVVVLLVWFSWPKALFSAVLGSISIYDIYKYIKIKTELSAARDREAIRQRKKQARKEALERRQREEAERAAKEQAALEQGQGTEE